jgi:carboxypeptidase PM20D1
VPTPDLDHWANPPFSGLVANGYVHGRGTIDDKHVALAIFESIEDLLKNGFKPKRTTYLAFGHDEEIGGIQGAQHIARHLQEKKVQFEFMVTNSSLIFSSSVCRAYRSCCNHSWTKVCSLSMV